MSDFPWLPLIVWVVICTVLILFVVPFPYNMLVCVFEILGGFVIGAIG